MIARISLQIPAKYEVLSIRPLQAPCLPGNPAAVRPELSRMDLPDQDQSPETARQFMDLLQRSRWFADSLFAQLLEQSQDYLDRNSHEFGLALVEKRCMSPWHVAELLAGRHRFYGHEVRLLEQISCSPDLFVAEQMRVSRLVLVEVDSQNRETILEFMTGIPLRELIRQRRFHRDQLNTWRQQLAGKLSESSFEQLALWAPERSWIDMSGHLQCLKPLRCTGSTSLSSREEVKGAFDRFFDTAEDQLDSALWHPAEGESIRITRSRYQHLLRKSPSWETLNALPSEVRRQSAGGNMRTTSEPAHDFIPDSESDHSSEFEHIEIIEAPSQPKIFTRLRTPRRDFIIAAWVCGVATVLMGGWRWIRAMTSKTQAAEEHPSQTTHPPSSKKPQQAAAAR